MSEVDGSVADEALLDPAQPLGWDGTHELVSALWPEVSSRLGVRSASFFSTVTRQCGRHGLLSAEACARYLNLCFLFGPAFEDKPENEWALGLLADGRLHEWVKVHQVVRRSLHELARRGGDPTGFVRADNALLDALDRKRLARDAKAEPLARLPCDLDTLDLQALETVPRREYRLVDGNWQRVDAPLVDGVRVDRERAMPAHLSVLGARPGSASPSRLRVRQVIEGGCGERHPAIRFIDAAGISRWHGHEAGSLSWPVHAMAQPEAPPGLGSALIEETSPAIHLLEITSCGVRDQGVPIGEMRTQVWVYPDAQWLFQLQREGGTTMSWPRESVSPGARQAVPATRVRVARDGERCDAVAWSQGFDEALTAALAEGFDRLYAIWARQAGQPTLNVSPDLLVGSGALTWGWKKTRSGLADPLLRVAGELDLGCAIELDLGGELVIGSARTQLRLSARGAGRLARAISRETDDTPLLETLTPAVARFSFPFEIDYDPIASNDGVLMFDCGPCTGALVGEAGLRPRTAGSGWQWYVRLAIEPVLAPVGLHDPVLGTTRRSLSLLPAMTLVDWSVG